MKREIFVTNVVSTRRDGRGTLPRVHHVSGMTATNVTNQNTPDLGWPSEGMSVNYVATPLFGEER
jgi:hypothetical protein